MYTLSKATIIKLFILTAVLITGGYLAVHQVSLIDANKVKKAASTENQKTKNEIGIELGSIKAGLQNGSQLGNSSIDFSKLNSSSVVSNLRGNFVSLQSDDTAAQSGNISVSGSVQGGSINGNSLAVGALQGVLKADQGAVSGGSTTSDLPEGNNLYYTPDRFDDRLKTKTTNDLAEGTENIYFTAARARASLEGTSPINYNTSTGNISLADSGVSAGTYGSNTQIAQVTVDSKGRVTSATNVGITPIGTPLDEGRIWVGNSSSQATVSDAVYIKSSGNVGIGTTEPNRALHVQRDLNAGNADLLVRNVDGANPDKSVGIELKGSGSGGSPIFMGIPNANLGVLFFENVDNAVIDSVSNAPLIFGTNNTERLRILSTGQVGIGATSPGAKLQVDSGATATIGQIVKAYAGQTADLLQIQGSDASVLAKIDASGNLTAKSATFTGTLTMNGHIVTGNASGSTTIAAGAAAGTGATASITGNDISGTITVTTGTGATSGALATVTFAGAYGSAPNAILEPKNSNGAALQHYTNPGTSSFVINSGNTPADSTTYTYSYMIMQ